MRSFLTHPRAWSTELLLGIVMLAPLGCSARTAGIKITGRVSAVATYSILGDLVKNVAGDKIDLVILVGPGSDAHVFGPTPKDNVTLYNADVIFENGIEFEGWLDKLCRSSRTAAKRVVVTKDLKLIAADEHDHDQSDQKHDHAKKVAHVHAHDHGENDPHVWHDVRNVIHMVGVIRDALVVMDPANKDAYTANAAAYTKELESLDNWVAEQTATIPPANRKLVTNHDTFSYFAKRYGFQVIGSALPSVSTEAAEPSAAQVAKLVEAIRATKVPAIFAENIGSAKVMEQVSREAPVKLAPALYTDALGKPGTDGESYVKMMRHNVSAMVILLKP